MGKLGRTLVTTLLAMVGIVVFVIISQPSTLTKSPYYGIIAGFWILGIIVLYLWLGILSESPRLKVTFGGGNRPGREDVGDHPYHIGGAIFGFVITVTNMGGKKLSLEPKMILRDRWTRKKLCESPLMPRLPIPESRAEQNKVGEHVGKSPPYCPTFLVLEPDDTTRVLGKFLVDKDTVDRIGVDEHDTVRVYSAEYSLKFIDNGLGIAFECADKGRNKFECRRFRS